MTGGGGRSARLSRKLLVIGLLVVNAVLIAVNLQKHQLFPFDRQADDPPTAERPVVDVETTPPAPTSDGPTPTLAQPIQPSPDPDDPFQARGAVPNGPAQPRSVSLGADGTAVITGSAPSGAVATAVVELVEVRLAPEIIEIETELSWHPAASSRPSDGVAVLEPALTYGPGQVGVPEDRVDDLQFAARLLAARPQAFAVVIGHIDDLGDSDENAAVAAARVASIIGRIEATGIDRSRLVAVVGSEDPDAPANDTEEDREFNRRVEIQFENLLLSQTVG